MKWTLPLLLLATACVGELDHGQSIGSAIGSSAKHEDDLLAASEEGAAIEGLRGASRCDGETYQGHCEGDSAVWCQDGRIKRRNCARSGLVCGWVDDTVGYYCMSPEPPPDPDPTPDADADAGTDADASSDADASNDADADGTSGGSTDGSTSTCGTTTEQEELALTNQARAAAGVGPLVCDEALTRAARLHSQDMCDHEYFSHTSLDGRSFVDRIHEQGVTFGWGGENIAYGYSTPSAVHNAWMNSSGHRANILNANFRRIGIGHSPCGGANYWTQDFTD